jgi:alpha/beta superfamily hydrolase
MRDPAAHGALVASLQDEYLADDLVPPPAAHAWSESALRTWFESGGESAPPAEPLRLRQASVQIPRAAGEAPLLGELLWPDDGRPVPLALLWCSANPGHRFGAEHMGSPIPAALAQACSSAGMPLLRFNYSGVRGSGGTDDYNLPGVPSKPFHPHSLDEAMAALAFLRRQPGCGAVAVGGHSMGASAATGVSRRAHEEGQFTVDALVSVGTAPLVVNYLPEGVRDEVTRGMQRDHRSIPARARKLFLVGEGDKMSPAGAMGALLEGVAEPKRLEVLDGGADHSLKGREADAAALILSFLQN